MEQYVSVHRTFPLDPLVPPSCLPTTQRGFCRGPSPHMTSTSSQLRGLLKTRIGGIIEISVAVVVDS